MPDTSASLLERLQSRPDEESWRQRQGRPAATGGGDFLRSLEQLEDPASDLSRGWDLDHDRHVARRLLEMIQPDFEAGTWQAFRRVALDGVKPRAVAAELGVT